MTVKKVCPEVSDAADNRYYVIVYNPNGGGQYKKVVRGKRAAEHHEVDMRARMRGGAMAGATDRRTTVRQLLDQLLASKRTLAASSRVNYRHALDAHVYPTIGDVRVSKLPTAYLLLTSLFDDVEKDSGPAMRRRVEMLVRQMLRVGVRQGILDVNPLDGVSWGKTVATRPVYVPEWESIAKVREAIEASRTRVVGGVTEMRLAMVDVLAGAGLRGGEMMALGPDSIDLEAGTITVSRQLLRVRGDGFMFGPPKTDDSGPRTIPVPKFVLASLATTQLRNGTRSFTLPWEQADGKPTTFNLIFFSKYEEGAPPSAHALTQQLRRIGNRIGLPGELHAHAYRHRYTTTLHDAGVPQRIIDYVTGHLPHGSVTMRVYTHATKEGLARVPTAIDAAWKSATEPARLSALPATP